MNFSVTSIEGNELAYSLIIVFALIVSSSMETVRFWMKLASWERQLLPNIFYSNVFNN